MLACRAAAAPFPAEPPAAEEGGIFNGISLAPAPVRWGGSLGLAYSTQRTSGAAPTLTRLELANINGATYLGQPWLAQLRGGLGLVRSTSRTQSADSPADSRSSSLTGDAALSLFPVSRFPFDAYLNVTDSRASGDFTASDYRNTRFGLRQSYRTPDESTTYIGRLERSALTSQSFARDTLDIMEASMMRRIGFHQLELTGNVSDNQGGAGGVSTRLSRLSGRHYYSPDANLSVESLASLNRNLVEARTAGAATSFDTRFMQLTSFGTWRPEEGEPLYRGEDRPLILTGSARLFTLASDSGGTSNDSSTVNATFGANYMMSPRTRFTANAGFTHTATTAGDANFTSQNASLIYTPEAIPLGSFLYTWSGVGSANNNTSSGQGARQSYSAQISHGVTRGIDTGPGSRLALIAGQSVSENHDRDIDAWTLTNSAGINWTSGNGNGGQTYIGVSGSDSRTRGDLHGEFQLVNLQLTRQNPLSNISYWTGNVTVQGTRQIFGDAQSAGFDWTATGSLGYVHERAFGVPRLRFNAVYMVSQTQLASRATGDIDASRDFTSQSAEARFDYLIGKLEIRLSARSAIVEQQRNSLVFLRAVRNF